ncbi:MAG: sodium-translocating pyrophosphatase, partial [Deltaproteobacteria bacterium]|nr:sodium-translocating pyrophosphatase [Deltaproteobacteria bacterium]
MIRRRLLSFFSALSVIFLSPAAFAGEADINLPDLTNVVFNIAGVSVSGITILYWGLVICVIGMMFGVLQYKQTKNLPAHKSMLDVSATIWETCKTYLTQQGKFLAYLWALIAICIIYYFAG